MDHTGLNTSAARENLIRHGYNELPSAKPKSLWLIALEVMKEPMFALLIGCGILYMILGDYREGIILLSSILIIIFITFYQYQKTEKALEALKSLASPRAMVIRDGQRIRIPGREVVPGDLLVLNEGDRIAADANLIEENNLHADESLLTGESIPVRKTIQSEKNNHEGVVFSGSLVVRGTAIVEVFATGPNTSFGKIGSALTGIVQEQTRLQKEMKALIRTLFFVGGIISLAVIIAYYFTKGDLIYALLTGLASAMAILPEEFPVVMTIFLALGAWRLSQKKVLTRNPSAIESLGSATVLCSDKTGTITQNKMEVTAIYDGNRIMHKNIFHDNHLQLRELLYSGFKASIPDSIDPTEFAIINVFKEINKEPPQELTLIKEYPFSRNLMATTRVMKDESGHVSISVKGAPETVLDLCKISAQDKTKHLNALHQLAAQGYRVLAIAHLKNASPDLPETQMGFHFHFLGFLGLEDPVRPEVRQAIQESYAAGVKVIMITGDYPVTAKSIGKQIGLHKDGKIMTGEELGQMNDEKLKEKIEEVNIFARVIPEQKLRIVKALQQNHEIVAMTGDGVNDAPALKAANIGIAMGGKGTDVAREASSLVLLDDNFASIVAAIRSGRRIFDNLQKAMSYIIAIHIPIIGLSLIPAFISSIPTILMPLHIVFMELIIDPVCSIAFESEAEEKEIMHRPPRKTNKKFFGTSQMMFSILQGLILLAMVLVIYFMSVEEGHSQGEVRAITFSALIVGNIFLILNNLSKTRSFLSVFINQNKAAIFILLAAGSLLMLTITVPYLQTLFGFEFPGYAHFKTSIIASLIMLAILEAIKFVRIWTKNDSEPPFQNKTI
ncbi:MAG: cation-translocating P-type ATPase [Saprospiraceae bacterium]|nr:cation-translocating P-type ATPase [Candidatus Vicinibacter affinis]